MRVFVAGGTGQLGQAALPRLVAEGHTVRATARGAEKAELVRRLGAEPVEVDLFDTTALADAIAGSDAVVRLTTSIPAFSRMRDIAAWAANNRLRTAGARALVDAARAAGAGTYVSESVTFVYADGGEEWLNEASATDAAGLSILAAAFQSEAEAARFGAGGGAAVVLRFGSLYSPTSDQTRQTARLARRRMFPVIGKGDNYYSSVAVSDAGAAITASLLAPPGTYNVVDDEPMRFRDYVAAYATAVGGPRPLRVPRRLGAASLGPNVAPYLLRSVRASNRRLREATGWAPEYPSAAAGLVAIAGALME